MFVEPIGTLLTLPSIGLLQRAMLRMRAGRTSAMVSSSPAVRRALPGFVPSGVLPIELCTLNFVLCNGFFVMIEELKIYRDILTVII